jgi:hypothetical protein
MRRKGNGNNWIDAFGSDQDSEWKQLSALPIAKTGWYNGNPPALAYAGGRFHCAYGNRSRKTIEVIASANGVDWTSPVVLRQGEKQDIGYPRLFTRSDGQLVCVYYFTEWGEPQSIQATIFEPIVW